MLRIVIGIGSERVSRRQCTSSALMRLGYTMNLLSDLTRELFAASISSAVGADTSNSLAVEIPMCRQARSRFPRCGLNFLMIQKLRTPGSHRMHLAMTEMLPFAADSR